jgi:polysaccharide biosynthesis protein PslG
MRRVHSTTVAIAALAATLAGASVAGASRPGDTEHGVDRDRLVAKAERIVEKRNGIEVLKVSRCGPQRRNARLIYSTWVCRWRAEGLHSGEVPYHCAGRAVWRRKRHRWRVEPCENRLQPRAPLLATPNPPPAFGFNEGWIFHTVKSLDLLARSKAQVLRTALPWGSVEPVRGAADWQGSDALYERLQARGIRPLWVLSMAPCFAQRSPGPCLDGENELHPTPQYYDELAQFAVTAARRYPNSIGFEVWNEPNDPRFWGGPPEPGAYAEMLKTVADALHSKVPGTTVVSAGLSPHADTNTSGSIGARNFLVEMYERGAAPKADAIGIHPYPGVGPGEDYVDDVRVHLGKVQNVMDHYQDGQRPLWATEFGASTAGEHPFDPEAAGRAVSELLQMFRRIRGIELALVHRFVEVPGLPGREGGFGVLSKDLVPKPAYCQLAAARGVSIPGVC